MAKDLTQAQARKELYVSLKSVPCADCRGTFDPFCMDFDHVPERGPKKCSVNLFLRVNFGTLEEMMAEVAKCDVVCANCHRLRTKARGMSKRTREKIGIASKQRWSDPAFRQRVVDAQTASHNRPELREIKSARAKVAMNVPAARKHNSDAQKKAWVLRRIRLASKTFSVLDGVVTEASDG